MAKVEPRFNIGKIIETPEDRLKKFVLPIYYNVKGLENANALAQYALRNRNNTSEIIAIIPAYEEDPVVLKKGRILDKIYRGEGNGWEKTNWAFYI